MFVVVFFLLVTAFLGTRIKKERSANLIIFALSALCAALLYSFRFA